MVEPTHRCRLCDATLACVVVDLGLSPLSNAFVPAGARGAAEARHPLRLYRCHRCHLVQLGQYATPEALFSDYAYFSSYSASWLRHAEAYAHAAIARHRLGAHSRVVEIASNDGYLLQYFRDAGIPVLGIEPAANVAAVATAAGIPTRVAFFGLATAVALRAEAPPPDLIVANNVLAHVPDLGDFLAGLKLLLAPNGRITIEIPHLLRLLDDTQFDTIYHEHFSYFSLLVAGRALRWHGLQIHDVEELPTHGGSLRLHVCHQGAARIHPKVADLRWRETQAGLDGGPIYDAFAARVAQSRTDIRGFFTHAQAAGRRVAGYGAPAKGNTLLNFCDIGPDLLAFTVDRNPHKQGKLLPGTRIPIHHPDAILHQRPDDVFILPWNLAGEITAQMAAVRDWGGRFVVPVPNLHILQ